MSFKRIIRQSVFGSLQKRLVERKKFILLLTKKLFLNFFLLQKRFKKKIFLSRFFFKKNRITIKNSPLLLNKLKLQHFFTFIYQLFYKKKFRFYKFFFYFYI